MRLIDADKFEKYLLSIQDKYNENIKECREQGNVFAVSYLNTHKDLLINIRQKFRQQPTVGEWIPCSERLPEDGDNVLVCLTNGTYDIAFIHNYDNKYYCWLSNSDDYCYENESIIAWMPLPLPFKEDE